MLDYEHPGPDDLAAEYDAIRPGFDETGSPRLGMGLNVGAQLFWQFRTDPGLKARLRHVVTYPEYWAFRLTGIAATEVTSLGCHTDLWNPVERGASSLVVTLGIAEVMAPTRKAGEVLGPILADIAHRTGLPADTPVHCGIHDSNASLLPRLLAREAPFSVVSTGTWVIAMAIGGEDVRLDPARDTLINVNAFGDPVPSARFMGGREYDILTGGAEVTPTEADIAACLEAGRMLLPAVIGDTGPFQGRSAEWIGGEPAFGTGERAAAVAFYLALMTSECLDLIGHQGPIHVEGPFARNAAYLMMLASATGAPVHAMTSTTGTSQGAALLARSVPLVADTAGRPFAPDKQMADYVRDWTRRTTER
jgi:sugar (pentulose or hexulose) kinase